MDADVRPIPSKVAERREAKVAAIVETAWRLARQHGIAGVSSILWPARLGCATVALRLLRFEVALYDAMFADGNQRLLRRLDGIELPRDPRAALKRLLAEFVAFGLEDPAVPNCSSASRTGFTPSPASYVLAEEVLGQATS